MCSVDHESVPDVKYSATKYNATVLQLIQHLFSCLCSGRLEAQNTVSQIFLNFHHTGPCDTEKHTLHNTVAVSTTMCLFCATTKLFGGG